MKHFRSSLLLISVFIIISGCASLRQWGFFEKSNLRPPARLITFKPTLPVHKLWSTDTGAGTDGRAIKLLVTYDKGLLFTADARGYVIAINSHNGRRIWRKNINNAIMSGPGVGDGLVVVTTGDAQVVALHKDSGVLAWHHPIPDEALAAPVVAHSTVLVKTLNGNLMAYSTKTGNKLWKYYNGAPQLTLRGSSAPQVSGGKVIAGFADGRIVALNLNKGNILWERPIAMPRGLTQVEQMVDINADPRMGDDIVYAVSYQGNIAALYLSTGTPQWSHKISSYAGIALGIGQVFISDAESHIWAFDRLTGGVDWRQTQLDARRITGPVVMGNADALVVGDAEGYVHWLASNDGRFIARARVGGGGVVAPPLAVDNTVYVITRNGTLVAYGVG